MADASNNQSTNIGSNVYLEAGANATVGDINIHFNDLTSQQLVTSAKQILLALTRHEYKIAKNYLDGLKAVNTTNDDCRAFIQLLEYKFRLSQKESAVIDPNIVIQLLRSPSSNSTIKDIVESIYIQFLLQSSKDDARNRYSGSQYKNSYSKEVYFSFLANKEELRQEIDIGINDPYEHELYALVFCALRCEELTLAYELSTKFLKQFPNTNSQLLYSYVSALKLNREVQGRHIWILPAPIKKDFLEQIENCLSLISKNKDKRVVHIATALLATTGFFHSELTEFCKKNISEASLVCPDIEAILSDRQGKNEITALDVLNKKTLDESDFITLGSAFFDGNLKTNKIKNWLDDGVEIALAEANDSTERFIKIALNAIACTNRDFEQKHRISKLLDAFIERDIEQIHYFYIPHLYRLCSQLNKLGEHVYVIKLLETLIPDNPWASAIVDEYARALLGADQLSKLEELLSSIDDDEKSFALLVVEIKMAYQLGEESVCISKNRFALTKHSKSCYLWWLLLNNLHHFQSSQKEIDAVVDDIPRDILKTYSADGLTLLNVISQSDITLAQTLMLEWFIDNPTAMARSITNLLVMNIGKKQDWSVKYKSERCASAVVYMVDGKTQTRLLVEDCDTNGYLINIDTQLGKLLDSTDVGDTFELGMKTYTIKEKLSPIVGAFRISTGIREEINTGNDCFYQLSVQENNIDELLRFLDKIDKQPQIVNSEVDGQKIPLLLRLMHSHGNDLLRGCYHYLTDVHSNKALGLYNAGVGFNQSVVLDVLSLTYLSLTGFCHGLIAGEKSLFVTRETKAIVTNWLQRVGSPEYFSLSKIGDAYVRATADDVQNHPFYNNLDILINHCSLLSPRQIDMPEPITRVREHLDISHYSSVKASISHSIPILCLDPMMCTLYKAEKLDLINTYEFMLDASRLTPNKENHAIELFIECYLPVPILNGNIYWLCTQKNRGQYLASKIISRPSDNTVDPDTTLAFLTQCSCFAIHSAFGSYYLDLVYADAEWKYTVNIVYACCESAIKFLRGDTREARLALFIINVYNNTVQESNLLNFMSNSFNLFARGHFLNVAKINDEIKVLQELN